MRTSFQSLALRGVERSKVTEALPQYGVKYGFPGFINLNNRYLKRVSDITSVKFLSNGNLEVLGNARFGSQKPADAILFTRGEKVIALGQPAPQPKLRVYALDYEFANYNEFPVSDLYQWESYITPAQLTDSSEPLELWALDVRDMRITKLERGVQIDVATKSALIK